MVYSLRLWVFNVIGSSIRAYKPVAKHGSFFTGTQAGVFNAEELNIVAGEEVVFCYALLYCMSQVAGGNDIRVDFRLTAGLKKSTINGW